MFVSSSNEIHHIQLNFEVIVTNCQNIYIFAAIISCCVLDSHRNGSLKDQEQKKVL